MGHARQASSTYARFDRLDIASGGRQRPSHFHPIVDTHPHTHTPIFSTQSSLVVTHAYAVGTGVLVRRSAATSALGRSAAVRERRSLRGAAQRSSGDDHVGLSFPEPTFSSRASLDFLSSSTRSESIAEGLSGKQKVTRRFLRCLSPQTHNAGFFFQIPGSFFGQNFRFGQRSFRS